VQNLRIVIDTNVVISGAFFFGSPSRVLDACFHGECEMVVSPDILYEYQYVGEIFSRKHPNIPFQKLIALLCAKAVIVQSWRLDERVCRDPDDDKFISCAIAGKAEIIVSGDHDLLFISGYSGIKVVKPRDFVDKYLTEKR